MTPFVHSSSDSFPAFGGCVCLLYPVGLLHFCIASSLKQRLLGKHCSESGINTPSEDPRDPSLYGQPCCDRCFRESDIDPNNWRGYPVSRTTPFRDTRGGFIEPEDDTSSDVEEVAAPPKIPTDSVRRIGLAVRLALECHRAYLLHGRNECLKAKHLYLMHGLS